MKLFRLYRLFPCILLVGLLSCQSLQPSLSARVSDTYCSPTIQYTYDSTQLPGLHAERLIESDTNLTNHFSRHDLSLANAIGILPMLQQLHRLEGNSPSGDLAEIQSVRQKILTRLMLASSQISGLAAELDCEGERADQIATYLDQRDARRIRRLTLLSVVVGAVTTVATALIHPDNASKVVGVGGGVVSAAFGGFAAFSSNRTVQFKHERNLLTDVWNQSDQSSVYPPMVWYVLNQKLFSNSGTQTMCYAIRQRWNDYVLSGASTSQQALYFGKGGTYTADDLHSRANMLNQLQSSVRSINQDIQSLVLVLSR